MNIREAILKAADSVETSGYRFLNDRVEHSCGTPMCMLGWIGFHLEMHGAKVDNVARVLGLDHPEEFYFYRNSEFGGFATNASTAAALMRTFANDRYPAESRALIPDSVRAIFTMSPEQIRREFQRPTADELMAKFDETIEALKRA